MASPSLSVVSSGVTSVLRFMYVMYVYWKKWRRYPPLQHAKFKLIKAGE